MKDEVAEAYTSPFYLDSHSARGEIGYHLRGRVSFLLRWSLRAEAKWKSVFLGLEVREKEEVKDVYQVLRLPGELECNNYLLFLIGHRKILPNKPLNFEVILSSDPTPKANLNIIGTILPIATPFIFSGLLAYSGANSTTLGDFNDDESPAPYLGTGKLLRIQRDGTFLPR